MKKFFQFLLSTIIICNSELAISQHCGTFHKPIDTTGRALITPKRVVIKDRFGNEYNADEVKIVDSTNVEVMSRMPHQTNPAPCQAGMFTIYFAPETTTSFGFAVQANRDVIC